LAAWLAWPGTPSRGVEYVHVFPYAGVSGSTYTNSVWWDDSLTPGRIQGVIIHFNYAAGAGLYTNAAWRNFARDRGMAMLRLIDQDEIVTASQGLTLAQNTLNYAATNAGRTDISTNSNFYIFTGVSRGGTLGAINHGWAAGSNKTLACIAYHGNSFDYLPAAGAAAKAIPVLYPIAQLDPTGTVTTRQGDIEYRVRLLPTSYRKQDGLYWTTTMQYGAGHNSTGDDTYPLQWLGRVVDFRHNPATPGTLVHPASVTSSSGRYELRTSNTTTAVFTNLSTVTPFVLKDTNIWLPPGGDSDWLAESAPPGVRRDLDSNLRPAFVAPDKVLDRRITGTGIVTFSGSGVIGLDDSGGGRPVLFEMTNGLLRVTNGATLRNGGSQGGVWSNNLASLEIASGAVLDLWDGNAVRIGALNGAGRVTAGISGSATQLLMIGAGNASGRFTGGISNGLRPVAVTKLGTGTQEFASSNNYSGATTVSQGVLRVAGTLTGTTGVTVQAGAVLENLGTIRSAVLVQTGGTLTGGGTIVGRLTSHGTVRVTGGGTLQVTGPFTNFGIVDIMTAAQTLPTGFVNRGVVLDRSLVRVNDAARVPGGFVLNIHGFPGHAYQLESSTDLTSTNWMLLGVPVNGANLPIEFTDTNAPLPGPKFYRVRVHP
jgi:autotransporter-associated beta strand protein